MAEVALDEAAAAENPAAAPDDILAALRAQNARLIETVSVTNQHLSLAREQAAQAAQESQTAKAGKATAQKTALDEISRVRQEAAAAVAATQRQAQVAEHAAVVASTMRQVVGGLGALVSFAVDRAPVLGTLTGAYLLCRGILDSPTVLQLVALGLYGAVAVLPSVYLSIRRQ